MKEDYLHFLWRMKYVPSTILPASTGETIEILDFGEYNAFESGPDFQNARLRINGILWAGQIEVHLKSSDWFQHQHQDDAAYENVILHVVWEHDREVQVQGRSLPTLEFSKILGKNEVQEAQKEGVWKGKLPCSSHLQDIPFVHLEKQKELAIWNRLMERNKRMEILGVADTKQLLYELIAQSFGMKVNKEPFWEIARNLPLSLYLSIHKKYRYSALLLHAGLTSPEDADAKSFPSQAIRSQWRRKGNYPAGCPEKRLKQFAVFIDQMDFTFELQWLNANQLVDYLHEVFRLAEEESEQTFSPFVRESVIVNAIVPLLFYLGDQNQQEEMQQNALEVLIHLPAEKNHLTEFLKKAGFSLKNAYDTQALMQLYKQFCARKKCLTCAIGKEILNRWD